MRNRSEMYWERKRAEASAREWEAKIEAFQNEEGEKWLDLFEVLVLFEFGRVREECKPLVVSLFANSEYGSQIFFKDTPEGVRIHRKNIAPLIKASDDEVFWKSTSSFIQADQDAINSLRLKRSEIDWTR